MFIITLSELEVKPDDWIVVYGRETKEEHRPQLYHQLDALLWEVGWKTLRLHGFVPDVSKVKDFGEVHNGSTFDRPEFRKAIAFAKTYNAVIVAQDINRLVRHPEYHPKKPHTSRPLKSQLRELLSFGVSFALLRPLELSPAELRSFETKRGLKYSAKIGGRPTIVDEKVKQKVLSFHAEGYSLREIQTWTGVSKSTIDRIIKTVP